MIACLQSLPLRRSAASIIIFHHCFNVFCSIKLVNYIHRPFPCGGSAASDFWSSSFICIPSYYREEATAATPSHPAVVNAVITKTGGEGESAHLCVSPLSHIAESSLFFPTNNTCMTFLFTLLWSASLAEKRRTVGFMQNVKVTDVTRRGFRLLHNTKLKC